MTKPRYSWSTRPTKPPDPIYRVSCEDPPKCPDCNIPMQLYIQLMEDRDGLGSIQFIFKGYLRPFSFNVWFECDDCDTVEELLAYKDLTPTVKMALKKMATEKGWWIYLGGYD